MRVGTDRGRQKTAHRQVHFHRHTETDAPPFRNRIATASRMIFAFASRNILAVRQCARWRRAGRRTALPAGGFPRAVGGRKRDDLALFDMQGLTLCSALNLAVVGG